MESRLIVKGLFAPPTHQKPFTRAVSSFFKVNSSSNETVITLESESVIGGLVGVVEVEVSGVGDGKLLGT